MIKYGINYSFIIPHKNSPELLKRCVESIPNRDDIQIIVVDDNSDEDKKPMLPERKGLEIVLLEASQSKGAGRARNVGLEKATGKWLLFADADDEYCCGFLETLENYLTDGLQILYFSICKGGESINGRADRYIQRYSQLYDSDKRDLIRFSFWEPWNKVFSRDFINHNSLLFEERPSGNDMMFCLQASAAATNYIITNEHLYILYDQPNSITYKKKSFDAILKRLELSFKKDKFMREQGLEELRTPIMSTRIFGRVVKQYGLVNALRYLKQYSFYKRSFKEIEGRR